MQTQIAPEYANHPAAREAQSLLRKCVHCGFCTATCPTYQLLGDELDGPRGRIYLIKQVLEGTAPSRATLDHLDRCLTCRSCETTCPSGVEYGRLVDIGRVLVEARVGRPLGERALRSALKRGLTGPLFAPALKLGQSVRALLPAPLRAKVPERHEAGAWPQTRHAQQVILLEGCVQPAMSPNINTATARVLDALAITVLRPPQAGCCGALRYHLNDVAGGLADARRNIDAWWPLIQAGAQAIVINASGCGTQIKDYGHLLASDPLYSDKAQRVSALAQDISEVLAGSGDRIRARLRPGLGAPRLAFHSPCSLQHGQKILGTVESLLTAAGASLVPVGESHWCCGSAGTYSVLQPELSGQLRERKLAHLQAGHPELIVSANIGCITHLAAGSSVPVRHWIEWLDERLNAAPA